MLAMASHAQQRTTVDIRSWQFSRDSVEWQSVRIPHDWAIAGPFDKKWDLQNVAIEAQQGMFRNFVYRYCSAIVALANPWQRARASGLLCFLFLSILLLV